MVRNAMVLLPVVGGPYPHQISTFWADGVSQLSFLRQSSRLVGG